MDIEQLWIIFHGTFIEFIYKKASIGLAAFKMMHSKPEILFLGILLTFIIFKQFMNWRFLFNHCSCILFEEFNLGKKFQIISFLFRSRIRLN
jgi:hypothetical protein